MEKGPIENFRETSAMDNGWYWCSVIKNVIRNLYSGDFANAPCAFTKEKLIGEKVGHRLREQSIRILTQTVANLAHVLGLAIKVCEEVKSRCSPKFYVELVNSFNLAGLSKNLPIIDLGLYLKDKNSELAIEECHKTAKALKDYGALLIKDPRVTEDDNSRFLDLLEDYFDQPFETKLKDARPEVGYQVGVTPELIEEPKCHRDINCQKIIEQMPKESRPLISEGPDPKWRFFWRIGELPEQTKFPRLNSDPVVPEAFKDMWSTIMNQWGKQLHQTVVDVVEMTSVGFGMAASYLPDLTKKGPHLLAPTGSDLNKYGKLGTILAGFHYDLNFVTIHGKSRFPGLNIWPRNGSEKINVRVPDGHLLVQAGKQLEWLTGGEVKAGYHEVIVTEATIKAIEDAKKIRPNRPLWRISSTFFLHIASDNLLKPIEPFFKPNPSLYPPIATGDQVKYELGLIELMKA
nr:13034_t:CDS:10 [Entrophospora candida]